MFKEMKTKALFASLLVVACAITSQAQGYMDGIEFYKIGQYSNAKDLLERNLNNASTDKAEAYYYLGQVALHQTDDDGNAKSDLAKAKEYFDKGVAANPKNPFNYVGLGAVALKQGNKGGAGEAFKLAEKNAKKNPAVAIEMARAYYFADATAYHKDIEKLKNNAFKWNQNDPNYYIFRGDEYADEEEWGKSAAQYETALLKDVDNVEAYVKFANTYFYVNRDLAVGKLEELYQKQPNSALVIRQLAEKYYEVNKSKKAAEYYGKYIEHPNHFAQDELRYAQLLFAAEKYQESLDIMNRLADASTPGTSENFFANRIALYDLVALEKWEEAVAQGKKFFALPKNDRTPYNEHDYMRYASALQQTGRAAEAVDAYEEAIRLVPDNLDLVRGLAESYAEKEDYDSAIKYQKRIIENENCDVNDYFTMSMYYYYKAGTATDDATKAQALAESRKYITKADELQPESHVIVNHIARLDKLAEGENKGGALNSYQHLLRILDAKGDTGNKYDNYYKLAYNYLGFYNLKQGNKELAKEYYLKQLQHDPDNADLRNFIDNLK